MAIKFQAAPASAAQEGGGQGDLDFAELLEVGSSLNMAMLFVVVAVIYGIVVYLRATPGYRVTDIKLKRGASKDVAVQRTRAPERSIEPAE